MAIKMRRQRREAGEPRLAVKAPSNLLRKLRNKALKDGNFVAASAIRSAQADRKRGLNASVEQRLSNVGLAVSSQSSASRFPVEARMLNISYHGRGNFKRETVTPTAGDSLLYKKESKQTSPSNAQSFYDGLAHRISSAHPEPSMRGTNRIAV